MQQKQPTQQALDLEPAQEIAGILKDISVGKEVWGVNPEGKIYRNDSGKWTLMPGKLKNISSAEDGTVIGTNEANDIYQWDSEKGVWNQVDGKLQMVAVGSKFHIWGVGGKYHISGVNDDSANSEGRVFYRNNKRWIAVGSPYKIVTVSVGTDGTVYALDKAHKVLRWNPILKTFDEVGGALVSITVRDFQTIYGCNSSGATYKLLPPNTWVEVPFSFPRNKVVSFGPTGLWSVDSKDKIGHQDLGGIVKWEDKFEAVEGKLVTISSGSQVWGVNEDGSVYRYDYGVWTKMSGTMRNISVAEDGTVMGTNEDDEVFRFDAQAGWQKVGGHLVKLSVASANSVWGLTDDGHLYHGDGKGEWKLLKTEYDLVDVAAGCDGAIIAIDDDDKILQYRAGDNTWIELPGRLKTIACIDGRNFIGSNKDGNVYKWNKTTWERWYDAPNNVKCVTIGSGGVWAIDKEQRIVAKLVKGKGKK